KKMIDKNIPIIASLNPILLCRMKRGYNNLPDDIRGISWGHAIIISGYTKNDFILSDPGGNFYKNSFSHKVNQNLLLESILRYNGQLIIIER
ncbi:MAG: C39 family peptidase, partial [Patescibacteria group bacterium]|nr:C39 family peptidase [Patescibacteria group bacterium]